MKFHFEVVPLSEVPMPPGAEPIVLVVDDDRVVADTLSLILKRAGYATMTAYAPMDALEIVQANHPALLLSDIAMPEMNGVALAIAVRAMHPACSIILISGHAISSDLEAARDAGYNFPLLQKPVHPTEVLRHVAEHLRKSTPGRPAPPPSRRAAPVAVEVA